MLEEKMRAEARLRRLRQSEQIRALVRETSLDPSKFVAPVFVTEGSGIVEPIKSMPGVHRYAVDRLGSYLARLRDVGVNSVMLFGIASSKDEEGSMAYSPTGIVPRAVAEIKRIFPDEVVMADVCLCEYTNHGHCGILRGGTIDNDRTLPLLARAAVEYARAGADVVAPSAMMDGQVGGIRIALDSEGLESTAIMGYSAKYASSFYGPFREAAGSSPSFGDRRSYQMDPPNSREAMRELSSDSREGADILMVKPALAYLDVLSKARSRFDLPIAAYNVSGEYSMVKAAAAQGWIDEKKATLEILTSIKRAGADIIITYSAEQAANWLAE
ncbi:MAG TPA: porphobilinogen synthase [Nitrososphaerales archaeon]|nr:porphobilinogen synthase [Nitrososphaerales archaeon]